jgi:hypothetical protein
VALYLSIVGSFDLSYSILHASTSFLLEISVVDSIESPFEEGISMAFWSLLLQCFVVHEHCGP